MNTRSATLIASLALLAALTACGDRVENTEIPQTAQPNVEINRQGMEGAKEENTGVGVENKGQKGDKVGYVNSLGAKGDTSVLDPDVLLAERVKAALASNPELGVASVEVRTDEGDVTLLGRAPDPTVRERATEITRAIPNVRSVDNQITVG